MSRTAGVTNEGLLAHDRGPGERTLCTARGRRPAPMKIRLATEADLEAITAIYNEAIETTTATFDTEPKTMDEQERWFAAHTGRYPILVAEIESRTVGWACLSPWSGRCAYADTAETSFYVAGGCRGRGVGRALKIALIEQARSLGFHVLIAQIAEGADASRHLNESLGFQLVGTLREVGRKFGQLLDVHLYQLVLD